MHTSVEHVNAQKFTSYVLLYYICLCLILQHLKCYLAWFLACFNDKANERRRFAGVRRKNIPHENK